MSTQIKLLRVYMVTFSQILKSERSRLGFTQVELAEIGGVQRRAQSAYENGQRSPDSNYLWRIAAVGFDMQYLFTGVRSENLAFALEERKGLGERIEEGQSKYLDRPSTKIDTEVLSEVTAQVLNAMKWHESIKSMKPEQIANVISIVYNNYQLSGKKPRKSDPSIISALQLAAG